MVLASLVHYSARLKCGIDMVGISNFVTFLENTADYRRDLRRLKAALARLQVDIGAALEHLGQLLHRNILHTVLRERAGQVRGERARASSSACSCRQ